MENIAQEKKGMHARTMKSRQIQNLYAALESGDWRTTADLHRITNIENVSTAVGELRRAGGYNIKCIYVMRTGTGAKIYAYKLMGGRCERTESERPI